MIYSHKYVYIYYKSLSNKRNLKGRICFSKQLKISRFVRIISPDKARKGVIYPLKKGIYALFEISERTFTR